MPSLTETTGQQTESQVCDLVLLTWNRADLLVPCVQRILRYTQVPCRLILVDNASTEPATRAFLESVQGTEWVEIRVVRRAQNDGFAIGMNDGLSRTSAPWICLLNHDVLVTEGWLPELLRVAQANPQIGLLNPMSNEFSLGPLQPSGAIDDLAHSLRRLHGQWREHYLGVGFCLLMSRRAFDQVGYFDTSFRFMYYEDRDYSVRAQRAGFICAVADGAYVYHHKRSGLKFEARKSQLEENEACFYRKWQAQSPRRIAWVLPARLPEDPETIREPIRSLANEGHKVWVFFVRRQRASVPRHFQVMLQPVPRFAGRAQVLWRLLTKKKPFHQVIVGERLMAKLLAALRPFHHAEVVYRAS